jgi:hypothetical protein
MLMRPCSTLMNCGSSSSEVRRMKAPKGVMRGSSLVACAPRAVCPWPHRAELVDHDLLAVQAVAALRKITGPGELSFTPMAMASSSGEISTRMRQDSTMSLSA